MNQPCPIQSKAVDTRVTIATAPARGHADKAANLTVPCIIPPEAAETGIKYMKHSLNATIHEIAKPANTQALGKPHCATQFAAPGTLCLPRLPGRPQQKRQLAPSSVTSS